MQMRDWIKEFAPYLEVSPKYLYGLISRSIFFGPSFDTEVILVPPPKTQCCYTNENYQLDTIALNEYSNGKFHLAMAYDFSSDLLFVRDERGRSEWDAILNTLGGETYGV